MLQNVVRATRSLSLSLLGISAGVLATALSASAQTSVSSAAVPQIQQQVENSLRTTLPGNVHPLARAAFDRGAVEDALQAPRMQLLIKRPADREAALKAYIADIHQKGSANYHKWLTPDQLAHQYGPADSDIQTVTAWLQSQGFSVSKLSRAKSVIEFSGTAGQVKSAFSTQIHKYQVNGETHYANATNPQIPTALTPVVSGIVRLNDFKPKSQLKVQGSASYNPATHKGKPLWNYPVGTTGEYFFVAPGDFAMQYDTAPLTTAGITGTGQTIGIINDSNIDLNLVTNYRALFGLSATLPNVIIDGTDPGVNGDAIEAYLDVEISGSVAPSANIDLYIAADTTLNAGLDLAAQRAVDDDAASVLSLSFGACEQELGATESAFYNSLWEQAAAQGQTVMVSAGDSGSQGCYNVNASTLVYGLAVNGFASTPYNVAVGGTDFYYSDYASTAANSVPPSFNSYWAGNNTTTPATSILKPIPEQPWNDTQYGFNIAAVASGDSNYYTAQGLDQPVGGSGGASACATFDASGNCLAGYPKPAFQSALTPADSVRDIPDVSLFAANGLNYSSYVICASPGDCNSYGETATPQTVTGVGGTSASSPAFAGIMALVNQKYNDRQGQADYVLYPLAKQFPAAFHDVTAGSNNGPCYAAGTSANGQTIEDVTACAADGSVDDYSAAAGYDLASGLGSIDANVLVSDWNKVTFTPSGTTLALSPAAITHGATETLTATVTGATSGDVAFVSSAALPSNKGLNFATVGSNGVATLSTNALPGGTYTITADYGGNGTVAASASTAQSITVSPEASNINLAGFQTSIGASGSATETYITNGTSYPYGTAIYADIQPVGTSVTQPAGAVPGTNLVTNGIATGSATFTDTGGAGTATVALNTSGIAEWSIGNFAVGAHSITASYSGDASFKASTSPTPVTFTIVKGTPTLSVQPFLQEQQTGSNLAVQVTAQYVGVGTAPTGTVTVTLGNQTLTATLAPFTAGSNYAGGTNGGYSNATVIFTSVPSGVTAVTASYPGDGNWNAATGNAALQTGSLGGVATTTTLTVTPANSTSANNATVFTLSSTVTGSPTGAAPTGSVYFFADGNQIAVANLSTGNAGTPVTATTTVNGASILGGNNQIVAAYSGDNTYLTSFSAPATAVVDQSDFTLASQNQVVSIAAGASGTATVNLASESGFDANVNLSCASPTAGITCSITPGSVTVNGLATAKVTINVATTAAANDHKRLWYTGSSAALACILLFGIPARRRAWRSMLGLLLFAFLTANIGCGGGGSAPTPVLGTAATPTFSPGAGAVTTGTAVSITDSTAGAVIYYTTDGTVPTTSSTKYSTAVPVTAAETISAIATAAGYTQSAVGSAAYTITTTPIKPVSGTNPISHNVTIQVATPSGTGLVVVTGTVGAAS
jgi:subtilase family serine protease